METALVQEQKYINISIEQGKPLLIVLLDLSVTFDKVDHNILFYSGSLKDRFDLSGKVLR